MKDKKGLPAGRQVEFKVGKDTLRGTLFVPEGKGPFPGVIFFHGSGSSNKNYLPLAKILAENDILALAFNLRGCGDSDGNIDMQTYRNSVEDGIASLEFILKLPNVDKERIGLSGSSLGGFIASYILPKQKIKSLILRAPAAYRSDILDEKIMDEAEDRLDLDSVNYINIENYLGSLLVIESEKDDVVPSRIVKKYYDKAKKAKKRRLEVFKGAGHRLIGPGEREKLNKTTLNWFLETL